MNRVNGSDGKLTVDYLTKEAHFGDQNAIDGIDYVADQGTLTFAHGEVQKTVKIELLEHADSVEARDEMFLFELSNITPKGAKLSKKSKIIVHICPDE